MIFVIFNIYIAYFREAPTCFIDYVAGGCVCMCIRAIEMQPCWEQKYSAVRKMDEDSSTKPFKCLSLRAITVMRCERGKCEF